MKDIDIKKMLPDWTLTYVLSENEGEKIYLAEKEGASETKYSLVRAVFMPCCEESEETLADCDEAALREITCEKLRKTKEEFSLLRSMSGKGGWLSLKESYDLTDTSMTHALAVARMGYAQSLSEFIRENGFTQGAILKLGIDLCRGLEHLKKAGMVHGTLSPECIFVDENCKFRIGKIDPEVAKTKKITDTSPEALEFTAPWAVKYGVNYTSDTYSVGLIMYYLLNARKLPFEDEMPLEEATKKRFGHIEIPRPSNDIERITDIVMKACRCETKDRYQTPYQMRKDLEEAYVRLQKQIEEQQLKEKREAFKKLEKTNAQEAEKRKDISSVRTHEMDENEKMADAENKKKNKVKTAVTLSVLAVVLLLICMPKIVNRINYNDISRHKIQLASSYYKNTDKALEYKFDYGFDGIAKEPPIVIDGLEKLKEGVDYELSYENNVEIGQATIIVRGIGKYKGEKTKNFNINGPQPEKIEEFTASEVTDTSVTLTWSEAENANRYAIYRFHEKSQDWGDREFFLDASQRSITITGLKPSTEYSFRIRGTYVTYEGDETKGENTEITIKTKSE